MMGGADPGRTHTSLTGKTKAVPVRLIVRRVKSTRGFQLALFANCGQRAFGAGRERDALEPVADKGRHAEIETAICNPHQVRGRL